ncbi:hypothetical protein [Methylobacterium sp. V23]|uniref:hypothetical protein n=1 Tax=Methylobacterium sp. V23 TaxID=2044878 RepID=UPI0011B077A6|nr:hypothetical protein [Methylobacterium sp. V23]
MVDDETLTFEDFMLGTTTILQAIVFRLEDTNVATREQLAADLERMGAHLDLQKRRYLTIFHNSLASSNRPRLSVINGGKGDPGS